jgi:hypothetical protein
MADMSKAYRGLKLPTYKAPQVAGRAARQLSRDNRTRGGVMNLRRHWAALGGEDD